MKALQTILFLLLLHYTMYAQNTITGSIVYANAALSPVSDSATAVLYAGNTLIQAVPLDNNGQFIFDSVADGTYAVKAVVTKKSGGWNAMDAYRVLRHFVQMPPLLTGIYLVAADVNGSGGIPGSADELAILRRFVHQIPTFMPPYVVPPGMPDWVSQSIPVTVSGNTTQIITVKVLCTGDVNGSFTP